MTLRDTRTLGPWAQFEILENHPGLVGDSFNSQDLVERLQRLEVEENIKEHAQLSLTFENSDAALLTLGRIALGVVLGVTGGYNDLVATRRFVLTRLRGMSGAIGRAHSGSRARGTVRAAPVAGRGGGAAAGRANPGAVIGGAGAVVWEGRSFIVIANRIALQGRRWTNVSHSAIVDELAQTALGLRAEAIRVHPTEVEPSTTAHANESVAAFCTRLARRHPGFGFDIDTNGLYWGPAEAIASPPEHVMLAESDVRAWEIDGDLSLGNIGLIGVKGVDPRTRAVVAFWRSIADRGGTGPGPAVAFQQLAAAFNPRAPTSSVAATAAGAVPTYIARRGVEVIQALPRPSDRAVQAARDKLQDQIRRRWKLLLELVGNPKISLRSALDLDANFGPLLAGRWYCEKVTHLLEPQGVYTTKITARRTLPGAGAVGMPVPHATVFFPGAAPGETPREPSVGWTYPPGAPPRRGSGTGSHH